MVNSLGHDNWRVKKSEIVTALHLTQSNLGLSLNCAYSWTCLRLRCLHYIICLKGEHFDPLGNLALPPSTKFCLYEHDLLPHWQTQRLWVWNWTETQPHTQTLKHDLRTIQWGSLREKLLGLLSQRDLVNDWDINTRIHIHIQTHKYVCCRQNRLQGSHLTFIWLIFVYLIKIMD